MMVEASYDSGIIFIDIHIHAGTPTFFMQLLISYLFELLITYLVKLLVHIAFWRHSINFNLKILLHVFWKHFYTSYKTHLLSVLHSLGPY